MSADNAPMPQYGNFRGKDGYAKCPAGCNEEDTTEHLLLCKKRQKHPYWYKKYRSAMKIKHRENIKTLLYGEN